MERRRPGLDPFLSFLFYRTQGTIVLGIIYLPLKGSAFVQKAILAV